MATNTASGMSRNTCSPTRSRRKVVRLLLLKEFILMNCAFQDSYPRKSTQREEGGKQRVHREVLSKSVRLMSVVLERRNSEKYHMRRS